MNSLSFNNTNWASYSPRRISSDCVTGTSPGSAGDSKRRLGRWDFRFAIQATFGLTIPTVRGRESETPKLPALGQTASGACQTTPHKYWIRSQEINFPTENAQEKSWGEDTDIGENWRYLWGFDIFPTRPVLARPTGKVCGTEAILRLTEIWHTLHLNMHWGVGSPESHPFRTSTARIGNKGVW